MISLSESPRGKTRMSHPARREAAVSDAGNGDDRRTIREEGFTLSCATLDADGRRISDR